jgi:hypothetical protein
MSTPSSELAGTATRPKRLSAPAEAPAATSSTHHSAHGVVRHLVVVHAVESLQHPGLQAAVGARVVGGGASRQAERQCQRQHKGPLHDDRRSPFSCGPCTKMGIVT